MGEIRASDTYSSSGHMGMRKVLGVRVTFWIRMSDSSPRTRQQTVIQAGQELT